MELIDFCKSLLQYLQIPEESIPTFVTNRFGKKIQYEDMNKRILAHYHSDSYEIPEDRDSKVIPMRTVRFLKDFALYDAGYDRKTTNKSFLRTAELFKAMGVKNYYFHLQLNNPLLSGIDPWDPNLDKTYKAMIFKEAQENVWYVLRELVKINGKRFIGNRAVISFIWCCLNHINTLILMPRQRGKQQPVTAGVRTPNGFDVIGNIKPGSIISPPDGSVASVLNTYPQGKKTTFLCEFEDGRSTLAGPEHLWKVWEHIERYRGEWKVLNTIEIIEKLKEGKEISVPISSPNLTKEDNPNTEDAYEVGFNSNSITDIDDKYFNNSFRLSKELLQGLMDKKGYVSFNGTIKYNVINDEECDKFTQLCYSLGCVAYKTPMGRGKYTITIDTLDSRTLFKKQENIDLLKSFPKPKKFKNRLDFKSIIQLNEKFESVCIEVDHPDRMYVTDNHIATHNTVGMQALSTVFQYLMGNGTSAGLVTLSSSNRQQFVNAMKRIRSSLPKYLVNMSYKDKDSGNILTYQAKGKELENIFEIKVPSGGREGADNVARGNTFDILNFDEPGWMKFIENIMNGAAPTTLEAHKTARELGKPYYIAKATTPNSVLRDEGAYMYADFLDSTEWRENYFDSFSEDHLFQRIIKASPKKDETYPKVAMQFTHLQLGLGHEWVKETMNKLNLTWAKAKIDLLMMWTEEGESKLFSDKVRELLKSTQKQPLRSQEINNSGLYIDWFITEPTLKAYIEDPTEFITIGMDTSDAVDKDACTISIMRNKTGEVIGVGRYNIGWLDDIRGVIKWLIVNISNSLAIIERNRARDILDNLLIELPAMGIDPYKRLFNEIVDDPIKNHKEYKEMKETSFKFRTKDFYLRHKGKFGFLTSGTSRKQLYNFVKEAVKTIGAVCNYGILIDELIGLEIDATGRIDHPVGAHDDMVVSWLLVYWFLKKGLNKDIYGIPQDHILTETENIERDENARKFTQYEMRLFKMIRDKITKLTQELEETESNIVADRIEQDIKKLAELLPPEVNKVVTIDEVIKSAQQEREKRAKTSNEGSGNFSFFF